MEPISASFEVGEPAPGREAVQRAHRGGSCSLSPGLGLEAKPFSVLADSTPHGNSVGGCFAETLSTQRKQFSLLTALLFSKKQQKSP